MSLALRIPSGAGLRYRLRGAMYYANYLAGSYRKKVWLVGDGRSGTTWLSNLINYRSDYRFCFEPYHPKAEPNLRLCAFPYMRKGAANPALEAHTRALFTGRFQSWWSDQYHQEHQRIWYKGLLVKCIFAHLFLDWADDIVPDTRKVLLLRHPCAVASSKSALSNSIWDNDPMQFLEREDLREDFLRPHEKLIRTTTDPFLKSVLSWSIVNGIPLKQMGRRGLEVVFFERLCMEPEQELSRLFRFLGDESTSPWQEERLRSVYDSPSQTSRDVRAPLSSEERVAGWTRVVDHDRLARAMDIVGAFGLDRVYSESPLPRCSAAAVATA